MNILVVGGGGREHAIGWKIKQSDKLKNLFFTPGNAGTQLLGTNLEIEPEDFEGIKSAILENRIDLVVIGPEVPLAQGIHDFLASCPELAKLKVVGPKKEGAQLESSKNFAKSFMVRHNIPTARYLTVTKNNLPQGIQFLDSLKPPFVLKADGLAAGKGVLIIENRREAETALQEMLNGKFGGAGDKVIIEEFLRGIEVSVFVITDGKDYKILPEAKDYKRIGEGDTGLNTGGMGAISPVPFADEKFMQKVEAGIIRPTVNGLKADGIEYNGFIFFGLINVDGNPFVIEYNVRLGDPEAEVVLLRIKSDFVDLLEGAADGTLAEKNVEISNQNAVTVMMVSGGYPGSYEKGKIISALDLVEKSIVFHSGTKSDGKNILTNGGRVLAISSLGNNMNEALETSYRNAERIQFDKKYYRKDLGFDL
ncbi:MAG: phosphoribosylamine--glycine ligase [Mariniphaga sp.]|jgi:phosphoribosylamine--glycine ligase|nr:phosphoribosylamine--glycine ligase [Mariniphaga sp.]